MNLKKRQTRARAKKRKNTFERLYRVKPNEKGRNKKISRILENKRTS